MLYNVIDHCVGESWAFAWPIEHNFIICTVSHCSLRYKGGLIKLIIKIDYLTPSSWCKTLVYPLSFLNTCFSYLEHSHRHTLRDTHVLHCSSSGYLSSGVFQAMRSHLTWLLLSCSLLLHWGLWGKVWVGLWAWSSQCGAGSKVAKSPSHQRRTFPWYVLCQVYLAF